MNFQWLPFNIAHFPLHQASSQEIQGVYNSSEWIQMVQDAAETPKVGTMLSNQQTIGSIAALQASVSLSVIQCYHLRRKKSSIYKCFI